MLLLSNSYSFVAPPVNTMVPQMPLEYYSDEASHGNYQFTTLKDIVNGLLMNRLDGDNYLKNTNRNLLIYHAKMEIKEVTNKTAVVPLAIEMTVGDEGYIVMPQDYVAYRRISVVMVDESTNSRRLCPLDVNLNINTAIGYLQDNNAQILFDDEGNIITSDASNTYNMPYKSYQFTGSCVQGGMPYVDASKFSEYGEFTIDVQKGRIAFSSNLINREVVVEYDSDGLQWEAFNEGEIKVHKHLEQVVKDGTYYRCIEQRQMVPANEKRRALDRYKTTLHQARLGQLNLESINRAMRSRSKY